MDEREKTLREVIEGIDGLVMLSQWELSLATDLRKKMSGLVHGGVQESPPPGPSDVPPDGGLGE